jgi:hypothetical protein
VKEAAENRGLVLKVNSLFEDVSGYNTVVVPYLREDGSQVVVEGIFVTQKDQGRANNKHSEAAQNALAPYVGGMPEIQPHQALTTATHSHATAAFGGPLDSTTSNMVRSFNHEVRLDVH